MKTAEALQKGKSHEQSTKQRPQTAKGLGRDLAVCDTKPGRTVASLKMGESGVVADICVKGQLRRRLFDMGVTPGANVVMRKAAPLGDPLEINLRGYSLTLRKSEASLIVLVDGEGASK